jgi:hypothetical protein
MSIARAAFRPALASRIVLIATPLIAHLASDHGLDHHVEHAGRLNHRHTAFASA